MLSIGGCIEILRSLASRIQNNTFSVHETQFALNFSTSCFSSLWYKTRTHNIPLSYPKHVVYYTSAIRSFLLSVNPRGRKKKIKNRKATLDTYYRFQTSYSKRARGYVVYYLFINSTYRRSARKIITNIYTRIVRLYSARVCAC